jgi:cobalt-zinc-cadmium resistance protein CzcA
LLSPTVYGAQKKVNATEFDKEKPFWNSKNKVALEISKVYHQIVYLQNQENCTSIW